MVPSRGAEIPGAADSWAAVGIVLIEERPAAMTTRKFGIASYEDMKERTMAIARGELKPAANDPKIWFTSSESFAKALSGKNHALLSAIVATDAASPQDWA